MRLLIIALTLAACALPVARPLRAQPAEHCSHEPTVSSLRACVQHAVDHGLLTDTGVAVSLLAKLDVAEAALGRGQPKVAVAVLDAFIRELGALAEVHLAAEHAAHLEMHARQVIAALT